jgi:hypothetical protein
MGPKAGFSTVSLATKEIHLRMGTYYYAYHGPDNAESFNYKTGYGVSQKYKQEQTSIGDRVFIIQKRKYNDYFELCGVFEIVDCYHDPESTRPHRMKLEDCSKLSDYVRLPENKISKRLPEAKGDQRWSVFKRHFCRQGVSFQSPLKEEVVSLLNSYLPRVFLPEEEPGDIESRENLVDELTYQSIKSRRGQSEFRKALLAKHDGACCISKCGAMAVLEAAHIIPHTEETNYSLTNGLLLRADIHTLYDLNFIGIDASGKVHVSTSLKNTEYSQYHGVSIGTSVPKAMADNLAQRFELFEKQG